MVAIAATYAVTKCYGPADSMSGWGDDGSDET